MNGRRDRDVPLWVLAVDEGGGTLWCGSLTPRQSIHVESIEAIENRWDEHEHEHGRPSPLAAKDGHTHAAPHHETETMRRRFAKDVAEWIEQRLDRHDIKRLHLFAAPRLLGDIRLENGFERLADRIEEHTENLTPMSAASLAQHPSITALFGAAAAGR